jgi:hypothetical protein
VTGAPQTECKLPCRPIFVRNRLAGVVHCLFQSPGGPQVVSRREEFRQHAAMCLRLADETDSPDAKASLLTIAAGWHQLEDRWREDEEANPKPKSECQVGATTRFAGSSQANRDRIPDSNFSNRADSICSRAASQGIKRVPRRNVALARPPYTRGFESLNAKPAAQFDSLEESSERVRNPLLTF